MIPFRKKSTPGRVPHPRRCQASGNPGVFWDSAIFHHSQNERKLLAFNNLGNIK
jgi:hypothetical protein